MCKQWVNQATVASERLLSLSIPLPPLPEQCRIAAILDKADALRATRREALGKLDSLAQAIFLEMFGLHTQDSNGNTPLPISDLVDRKSVRDTSNSDQVWSLSLDQVEGTTGRVLSMNTISRKELGNSTYYFKPPVVLYSKLRPYLNKVVIPEQEGYATTELVPLYCVEKVMRPIFMATYLRSSHFVDFASAQVAGAKMPRITMDKFWNHQIPVPPIDLQDQFGRRVASVDRIKKTAVTSLLASDELFSSLQHRAFQGEL